MEKIIAAAIRTGSGEVYIGKSHIEVRQSALQMDGVFLDPFEDANQEGFKTDSGRFVDRFEGANIALESGQITEKVQKLCSYMLTL